jgi:hypothetical protein
MSTFGRIGYHESHPERLALIRPDGAVSNWTRVAFPAVAG